MKLDLACGKRKRPGFTGVDISPDSDADIVLDLRRDWDNWEDESIEEVVCQHFLEHLSGPDRIHFMEELWRILIPGGKATIITPWWASWRAVADPTHQFPPIVEQSYLYFNKRWREENKLDHMGIECDFDFTFRHVYNPEIMFSDTDSLNQGVRHYLNVVDDLEVILTRR